MGEWGDRYWHGPSVYRLPSAGKHVALCENQIFPEQSPAGSRFASKVLFDTSVVSRFPTLHPPFRPSPPTSQTEQSLSCLVSFTLSFLSIDDYILTLPYPSFTSAYLRRACLRSTMTEPENFEDDLFDDL